MNKFIILLTTLLFSFSLSAQEWDDPITTSDWNQLWRSSFIQSNNASNAPEGSGWFWGINMNHSSNSPTYRYNGQIAIKNDGNSPTMYFRSTNSAGSGVWAKVINSRTSSIGTLTTLNSLLINGNNLDSKDLTFLKNSGSTIIGWNRSRAHGETDFISNRGLGSLGGFEFRDIDNSGNETLLMKIEGDGNVGIGTTSPATKLETTGTIRVTSSTPVIHLNENDIADQNFQLDVSGGNFNIRTNNSAFTNASTKLSVLSSGNVGIGTTSPDSKLTVAGNIHSREVKVTVNAGADFVFDESYQLRTLEETEKFISENKHLPEIASENEMLKDGLQVGEMNIKLLQKIEELTLYLIEQNKELKSANIKIEQLQKEVADLKNK